MGQPAARVGDMHTCPMVEGNKPHTGGKIGPLGSPNVNIGGSPAARLGDKAICIGAPDTIIKGSKTVMINKKPAARLGDSTIHGGVITQGLTSVNIGE